MSRYRVEKWSFFQITMIFTMKVITTDLLPYRLHPAETQKKKASPPLVKNLKNAKCYYINNG